MPRKNCSDVSGKWIPSFRVAVGSVPRARTTRDGERSPAGTSANPSVGPGPTWVGPRWVPSRSREPPENRMIRFRGNPSESGLCTQNNEWWHQGQPNPPPSHSFSHGNSSVVHFIGIKAVERRFVK